MKKIILLFIVTLFTFGCSNEPTFLNTESVVTNSTTSTAKAAASTLSSLAQREWLSWTPIRPGRSPLVLAW